MFKNLKEKALLAIAAVSAMPALADSQGVGGVVKGVSSWADTLKDLVPNLLILGGWICIGLGAWQFAKAAKPNSQGGSYVYAFMLLLGGVIMVGHKTFIKGTASDMGFEADSEWSKVGK